jgi:hypothetical protein
MIIKVFSSFCSTEHMKEVFERIFETSTMLNYGKDKDNDKGQSVYITCDEDYTHAILLNTAMPVLKDIPKEHVIGLAYEPPFFLGLSVEFIEYAQKYISKYYIGNKFDLPEPFTESNAYLAYHTPLTYLPTKRNTMSIMVSTKNIAPGHKYRHFLVQRILSMNLPIDIYGNGCDYYKHMNMNASELNINMEANIFSYLPQNKTDSRIKGEFVDTEPYESYDFHIAIENFKTPHYFSEKIINPLLCSTTPVYWGCQNITSYFPNNVIVLTGNINADIGIIQNILRNPSQYKSNVDVDTIKNKVNLLKNLDKVFPSGAFSS